MMIAAAAPQVSQVNVDHAALSPLYVVAATAVVVLLVDLLSGRRLPRLLLSLAGAGVVAAAVIAVAVTGTTRRESFCVPGGRVGGRDFGPACSYVTGYASTALTVVACLATLIVLALSAPLLRHRQAPAVEYCFLLLCSLVGVIVLVGARDLVTLVVATEGLTLPLYVLVALGRHKGGPASATTFFLVSVVSTAIGLLGASLIYARFSVVHFSQLAQLLSQHAEGTGSALFYVAAALLFAGLFFKLAAVPFHGWAPGSYDAAPLPVVTYLSTVSKLGGLTAVLLVTVGIFGSQLGHIAVVFAAVAVASMTLGNLAALRQVRLSRLLAWSSIAQLGYALAPLGALGSAVSGDDVARHVVRQLVAGSLGYLVLYLAVTFGLLAALVAIRAPRDDGGSFDDLRGLAYRRPWLCAGLLFGVAGLAGLPPALAGMFAKLAVLHALLDAGAVWLAVVVACNAVIGLAVYGRLVRSCFRRSILDVGSDRDRPTEQGRLPVSAVLALAAVAIVGVVPQPIFDVCDRVAGALTELLI